MKHSVLVTIGLVALPCVAIMGGCAEKPAEDMAAAEQAIQQARETGASQYAPEELRGAEEQLLKAQEEISLQDNKFVLLRNYSNANQLLTQVQTEAVKAKSAAEAKKEEARANANAAIVLAKTALTEAQTLLAQAPSGKGTQADLQALHSDLQAAEALYNEAEQALNNQDFDGAMAKAQSTKDLASKVHMQVAHAIQKVSKSKA